MKYDWEKNAESWRKALHARIRFCRIHVGGSLLFVFVIIPILTWIGSFVPWSIFPGQHPIIWFTLAGMILFGAVMSLLRLIRDRLVAERVLLHKTCVCPKCLTALGKEHIPANPDENFHSIQCCSCSTSLVLSEVEDYWAIYPDPKGVFRSWRKAFYWYSYQGNYDPSQPLAYAYYVKLRTYVVIAIVLLAGYLIFMSVFYSGDIIIGLLNHSPFALFTPPFLYFAYATMPRRGRSIHCHKCQYEKAPGAGVRCSECGEEWYWPFQCLRGQNKLSPRNKCISLALYLSIIIGPILIYESGLWVKVMRILPSASLITQITEDPRGFRYRNEWDILNLRTLSSDETRTLFLDVLSKHQDQGWVIPAARYWFNNQLKNGTIPRDLQDRYYRGSLLIHSLTPTTAALGDTIQLTLNAQRKTIRNFVVNHRILLERIEINGQPVPDSRLSRVIRPYHFVKGHPPDNLKLRPLPPLLTLPDHSGPVRIKLIYWQVIVPKRGVITPGANTYDPPRIRHTKPSDVFVSVEWNDDDTPILPPDTIWSNRIEQDFTITVK